MNKNKIVVDLSKVQYAWQSWITLCGNYKRQFKPENPTVHGQEFDCDAPAFGGPLKVLDIDGSSFVSNTPTMLQRAEAKGILDTWIPCTTLQLTANHRLTYTGKKAEVMWKAWNERIFNKKGKKK